MKRLTALFLAALLLAGCAPRPPEGHSVTFYYPRKNYITSVNEGVMGQELRDAAEEDLEYLLRLYLLGPLDEGLITLYPQNTRLLEVKPSGTTLIITLSDTGNRMTSAAFTLAGACLAQTFFGDYTAITIRSGDRDVTFRPGSLVLEDESATLDGNTVESEDSQ